MVDQYISKNGWARKLFDLGLALPAWAEVVAAVNFVGGAAVSNANPMPVTTTTTVRTAALSLVTTNGSTSAGLKAVSFFASGTVAPTVGGVTIPVGSTLEFTTDGNDTLAVIAYTASASASLIISTEV